MGDPVLPLDYVTLRDRMLRVEFDGRSETTWEDQVKAEEASHRRHTDNKSHDDDTEYPWTAWKREHQEKLGLLDESDGPGQATETFTHNRKRLVPLVDKRSICWSSSD